MYSVSKLQWDVIMKNYKACGLEVIMYFVSELLCTISVIYLLLPKTVPEFVAPLHPTLQNVAHPQRRNKSVAYPQRRKSFVHPKEGEKLLPGAALPPLAMPLCMLFQRILKGFCFRLVMGCCFRVIIM